MIGSGAADVTMAMMFNAIRVVSGERVIFIFFFLLWVVFEVKAIASVRVDEGGIWRNKRRFKDLQKWSETRGGRVRGRRVSAEEGAKEGKKKGN